MSDIESERDLPGAPPEGSIAAALAGLQKQGVRPDDVRALLARLLVMPVLTGMANYFVPLMIGARDVAFPRLNAMAYWLFPFSGLMLHFSWLAGGAPDIGWFSYAANVGFNYRSLTDNFGGTSLCSEFVFGASAGVHAADRHLLVGPELYGSTIVTKCWCVAHAIGWQQSNAGSRCSTAIFWYT